MSESWRVSGAGGGIRTHTPCYGTRGLSPLRLPFRHPGRKSNGLVIFRQLLATQQFSPDSPPSPRASKPFLRQSWAHRVPVLGRSAISLVSCTRRWTDEFVVFSVRITIHSLMARLTTLPCWAHGLACLASASGTASSEEDSGALLNARRHICTSSSTCDNVVRAADASKAAHE